METQKDFCEFDEPEMIEDEFGDSPFTAEEFYDSPDENLSISEIIQKNISKSIRDLGTFFSAGGYVTEKGDPNTNVINVSERKTYNLPDTQFEEMFTIMDICRKEQRNMHFSERQETATKGQTGIMIDFDRYQKSKEPQITPAHFDKLTGALTKILRESIDFAKYAVNGNYTFRIFYIRKPSVVAVPPKVPGEPTLYKDGFHVLIPEIQITKGFKKYIIDELINSNSLKIVFKDIDHIDSPDKMLDKMSASVPVYFFGSSKPGKPAYQLTHAHEISFDMDGFGCERRPLSAKQLLSGKVSLIHEDSDSDIPINLTYELSLGPSLTSISKQKTWLRKQPIDYIEELEQKIKVSLEKTNKGIIADDEIDEIDNSVDILALNNADAAYLKKLLGALDIQYATEYALWIKVIFAIANASHQYKPLAVWFSHRKPEAWSPSEIDRIWNEATSGKFKGEPVTIRSLKKWIQQSSPQQYNEINKDLYFQVLARHTYANEGRIQHAVAAKVISCMIGDKFVVDVGFNDSLNKFGYCWYEFVTPGQAMKRGEVYKWRLEAEPDNIHLFIGEHLPKVYDQILANIKERQGNAAEEGELKYWKNVEKNFKLSRNSLGNDQFQNGVIRQAKYRFRERGFCEELDSYENIMGVGNGILVLGHEPKLIRGFHEYKISKFTTTNYVPYNPNNPKIQVLESAFHDIYPEPDAFLYMMCHASTGLDGYESACILTMQVGGGRNGKTFYAKMVHNTLGNDYCASGKSSLLTAPMERGENANSAQMQQKDKHWFYIDEFNNCETLNTLRIKAMVTPGWQSGRDLHQRQGNFKNTSNVMCLSNFDFIVETTDHGTWRRIKYYKNKVKFTEHPNPENPYEKKVDLRYFRDFPNDPEYLEAMLSIMVHYNQILWRDYSGDLNNIPTPTIDQETELFRNRQDALNRFITLMVVKSPKSEGICTTTLANKYMDWYLKSVTNTSKMSVTDAQSAFENSRISNFLERRGAGVYYLVGHRLKLYPEEPLIDGEEELLPFSVYDPTAKYVEVPDMKWDAAVADARIAADKARLIEETYLTEIQNNTPLYVQSMDNIADMSVDELTPLML